MIMNGLCNHMTFITGRWAMGNGEYVMIEEIGVIYQ